MAAPWTTAQIPPMDGRLAVVTGANSGIGLETARALALAGADVVLATRRADRGEKAAGEIRAAAPGVRVTHEPLDLSRLESVRAFAEDRRRDGAPIDLLVNNAGIMAVPRRQVTVDGFELQLATNFLGHFALTGELLDRVRAAPAPRVVNLSSGAARAPARIHLDDLQLARHYSAWGAYGQSKLAMLIFALELDRRSRAGHWGILSNAAHPGFARTNLQTTGPRYGKGSGTSLFELAGRVPGFSQSAADGALSTLFAATSPEARPGGYYGPTRRFGLVGPPGPARPPPGGPGTGPWPWRCGRRPRRSPASGGPRAPPRTTAEGHGGGAQASRLTVHGRPPGRAPTKARVTASGSRPTPPRSSRPTAEAPRAEVSAAAAPAGTTRRSARGPGAQRR